jgi:hypothetical protein
MDRFVLICGKGRSGSNRLLDAFDRHEGTICRSELNAVQGGDFKRLRPGMFEEDLTEADTEGWCRAVARARFRQSGRDRFDQTDKAWMAPRALAALSNKILSRPKARRGLSRVVGGFDPHEWNRPSFTYDREKLQGALLALKILSWPGYAVKMHDADPGMLVVHNIRHPAKYLNSWMNRFVERHHDDHEEVYRKQHEELGRQMAWFGRDVAPLGAFSEENFIEGELWRWRFINEVLHTRLAGSDRYRVISYEAYEADPLARMKDLFAFAQIPFEDRHAEGLKGMSNTLFAKPHGKRLDADLVRRLIDKVLEDSPLMSLIPAKPAQEAD